jgi:DNA-binding MarR family transcriptional regulator
MSDISQLATNIHRLSNVLGKVGDRTLQDGYGFGISQFKIIWMLHHHSEGVLQTTIASWLTQTEAAVSRQIGLLNDDGLIKKHVDPQNRRNHVIMLSNKGKALADDAMKSLVKEYKPYFAGLSAAEQDVLNAMLEKVFFAVVSSEHENGK